MKKLLFLLITTFCLNYNAQDLYDLTNITQIEITFTDANWDQTMDTYYSNDLDERLLGACTVNGFFFDSVGVKYKGNSTYSANNAKNPLNIKLNYTLSQDYDGYETLKLSSGKNDPSFVREVLSYEIGRKYMDMPLSNYAKVFINGDFYGMFSSSESIGSDYQERHLNADGNNTRFKCNPVNTSEGSSLKYIDADSSSYFDFYELKSDFGWDAMVSFTDDLLNNSSLENYLDVDRAIWMLAFDNTMANLDSYIGPFRQNYYMIVDDNNRFLPIVWDLNECIGGFEMVDMGGGGPGGPGGGTPPSVTDLTEMDLFLRDGDTEYPLVKAILENSTYKKMYVAHCKTIIEENLSNDWYYTEGQILQNLIESEVANDPNAFYTSSDFSSNLTTSTGTGQNGAYGVQEVLDGRATYLENTTEFGYSAPSITNINTPSLPATYSTITVTADISNATYVYLGSRNNRTEIFQKMEMFDDGTHNDGAASDGTYGVDVDLLASGIEYYIYAENNDAGIFSPERAEHDFFELATIQGLVINELLASNASFGTDEGGGTPDWIELYNNTGSTIDLTGYYLSDDATDLTKWEIPVMSISAGGYQIFWADNDTLQSSIHTNFKLSASGETLLLVDPSLNVVDQITFGAQTTDESYARYPNGTGAFTSMSPTFDAENSGFVSVEAVLMDETISVYPNPTNSWFKIEFDNHASHEINIYNLLGELVYAEIATGDSYIETLQWKPGVYLVEIGGQTKKIIKK